MAVRPWSVHPSRHRKLMVATVVLDGGDSSNDLNLPEFPDKTIHVFGSFGDSEVTVLGLNDATGNGQVLHRTDDPSATFSGLAAEVMAHIIENPFILRASASGSTGSDLTVVVVAVMP